jgi:hypothetical protein
VLSSFTSFFIFSFLCELALSNITNFSSYFDVMFSSKNSYNLSLSIPPLLYNFHPITPFDEIANMAVYFLKTSCDCVCIVHLFPKSL